MSIHPRLGVSNTTPSLVSSGPGAPAPHANNLSTRHIAAQHFHGVSRHVDQFINDCIRSTLGRGESRAVAHHPRAIERHRADDKVGAADVEQKDPSHAMISVWLVPV